MEKWKITEHTVHGGFEGHLWEGDKRRKKNIIVKKNNNKYINGYGLERYYIKKVKHKKRV